MLDCPDCPGCGKKMKEDKKHGTCACKEKNCEDPYVLIPKSVFGVT